MNTKEDNKNYGIYHEGILRGLFTSVNASLKEANEMEDAKIGEEYLEGIVENIVFGVAAVIDGSTVMEFEEKEIHPHLTFKKSQGSDTLIINDKGSYLHEMVMGYLDEYDIEEL